MSEKLYLRFHGRIIDSLGIQMYQSPVAAVAELIANTWDADANMVNITLPETVASDSSTIAVADDGIGMTFEECQDFYLSVGRNRRFEDGSSTTSQGRPVLGRKGIGKFAAFGIAGTLEISTVSRANGEKTVFELDLEKLRGEEFVSTTHMEIKVREHLLPRSERRSNHGTTITLRNLKLKRTPNAEEFARSMARRFLLIQAADQFSIRVNDEPIPDENELAGVQFDFPRDYSENERP